MRFYIAVVTLIAAISTTAQAQTREVSLDGVTVYDPQELLEFAMQVSIAQYGAVNVAVLPEIIEVIYREDGYFLAEVFSEPDGTSFYVDEGAIDSVLIDGADSETAALIRKYMQPLLAERPTTLPAFERAIMLSEDIGSISVTAEVDYPNPNGAAELRLIATQENASNGFITLDHPARRLGKEVVLTFGQTFLSALTPGDLFGIVISGSGDFKGDETVFGSLRYRMPIGGSGAFAEAYFGNVGARRDVDGALEETDIAGRTAILALEYPFLRSVDAYGYGLIELRHAQTEIDVGAQDFDNGINAVSATWIHGKALPNGGAWEYAASLTYGERETNTFGFSDGDASFSHLRLGAGYTQPTTWFGDDSFVHAEFWGQLSNNALPSAEQFYIGGRFDERGYTFAEAQGDSGISATLSVGRDVFPDASALRSLRPFAFLDFGYVTSNQTDRPGLQDDTFASVGVGVDMEFGQNVFVSTHIAMPLTDGPLTVAHDPALHISLTRSW